MNIFSVTIDKKSYAPIHVGHDEATAQAVLAAAIRLMDGFAFDGVPYLSAESGESSNRAVEPIPRGCFNAVPSGRFQRGIK